MIEEVKTTLGAKLFRAFVVVIGCLWVWHSFFSGVAEVGQSRGSLADANIKEATAGEALRRQIAEADEAQARACNARLQQLTGNANVSDYVYTKDGYEVKQGSKSERMQALYSMQCDAACKESCAALLSDLKQRASVLFTSAESYQLLDRHFFLCPLAEAQQRQAIEEIKRRVAQRR